MKIHIGDRVRIVTANGCMAHVRDNPREGTVVRFVERKVYGSISKVRYTQIRLDNGDIIEKCAEPGLWSMHEGLPEYQE